MTVPHCGLSGWPWSVAVRPLRNRGLLPPSKGAYPCAHCLAGSLEGSGCCPISDYTIGPHTLGNDQFFPLEPPESALVPPPSLPQH